MQGQFRRETRTASSQPHGVPELTRRLLPATEGQVSSALRDCPGLGYHEKVARGQGSSLWGDGRQRAVREYHSRRHMTRHESVLVGVRF
jgi:hypothetical protein